MKIKWFVIAVLSTSPAFIRAASAAAGNEHGEGATKIPATVGGIWAEVKEREDQLGKMIAADKLDKVHEAAFEIRDLVDALHDKSKNLSADELLKVKADATYVADIAKRLDESGDAGDQIATEDNFKKLQHLLKAARSLYGRGAPKGKETNRKGHND